MDIVGTMTGISEAGLVIVAGIFFTFVIIPLIKWIMKKIKKD